MGRTVGPLFCGNREKMAAYKPRREASGETTPADTLTLDSGLHNCEKINAWVLSHKRKKRKQETIVLDPKISARKE